MSPTDRLLPDGYEPLEVLRSNAEQEVLRARGPAGEVVLRLGSAESPISTAELAVLGAVEAPGLARLVGYGSVPETGEEWVARSWIPGVDLGTWAHGRSPREIGALLAELCPPLQRLHEAGFVHADLKAENVIVTPDGRPVLTDFGLAHRAGRQGSVSGSLFGMAPEVLLGSAAGTAADLFALGVLLHELLVERTITARDFYARFPAEPYLAAVGTALEELPEWSRDLLAELLERDPARRPTSAAAVEATLRARLGLRAATERADPRRHRIRWSPLSGREAWLESALEELDEDAAYLRLPAGEDPVAFAEALRLRWTLEGTRVELVEGRDGDDLERFTAEALERSSGGGALLLPLRAGDRPARRRFAHLQRAWSQRRGDGAADRPTKLLALSEEALDGPRSPRSLEVPPVDAACLAPLLEREVEGDVTPLAEELARLSRGSLATAAQMVQRGFERGDFLHGSARYALRPDARVAEWAKPRSLHEVRGEPTRGELELFGALAVCGGGAPVESLRRLVAGDAAEFSAAVASAVQDGLALWTGEEERAHLVAIGPVDERVLDELGLDRLRELHAARAAELERSGEDEASALLHRHAADPCEENLQAVLERLAHLEEVGRSDVALDLAERFAENAQRLAPEHAARAAGAVAVAWLALGQVERAEEVLGAIDAGASDSHAALVERIRGRIAHQRRDFEGADAHLRRAAELEPHDGGESLFRRALLCFERRAEEALDECLREADEAATPLGKRIAWNLETLRAMSRFRRGELDEARRRLDAQLAAARREENAERESLARVNLATVERRTGSAELAVTHLERAVALQAEHGFLPALGQARAMLGAALRELGRLREAETTLRLAFELRDRLGDAVGACAVRGMLGLALADRGRLRAAIDELESGTGELRRAQRTTDALLLEARRLELLARIEEQRPADASERDEPAPDPRVLVARARAELLWRRDDAARDFARRALSLARQLGLEPVTAEALDLLGALGFFEDGPEAVRPSDRTTQDRTTLRHLAATPDTFDASAALEAAGRLAASGRDDLAARLALAVVARAESKEDRSRARGLAREQLDGVCRGLTEAQARRARRTLLGRPDQWPRDLDGYEASNEDRDDLLDMDLISLLDINHRLVAQADLPSLLGEVVESAIAVTRAERGFLVLEEDGELSFDTARTSRRGDIEEPELEVSRSALVKAMDQGVVLRLSNATEDPLLGGAPSVIDLQLRSILVAPFSVDSGLRGAIYVDHRLRTGAFSDRAERLLELLAGQAALAIRQARRMEEIKALNARLGQQVVERDADLATARRALREAGAVVPAHGLVGSSVAMREVHALIERCAPAQLPVLVTGESGTGKELAARALHESGPRRGGPFVSENCAALPASLIESELFGYAKGAFTGADRSRAGLFERAHGGTLFLDEIGELPIELQSKLLRALETGEIRRVGDSKTRTVDCRLVAATNRDLEREVAEERFRADLFFRLDVLQVRMPPLRDRVEDIPELVEHFLHLEAARGGGERKATPELLTALCRRPWPGNVRELANEVARLCVLCSGDLDDPALVRPPSTQSSREATPQGVVPLADLERRAILEAIDHTGGDKRRAAELLGVSRAKVYQRLKEWADRGELGGPAR